VHIPYLITVGNIEESDIGACDARG
jgi:hypothetical protein